jgi:hypothetical protein
MTTPDTTTTPAKAGPRKAVRRNRYADQAGVAPTTVVGGGGPPITPPAPQAPAPAAPVQQDPAADSNPTQETVTAQAVQPAAPVDTTPADASQDTPVVAPIPEAPAADAQEPVDTTAQPTPEVAGDGTDVVDRGEDTGQAPEDPQKPVQPADLAQGLAALLADNPDKLAQLAALLNPQPAAAPVAADQDTTVEPAVPKEPQHKPARGGSASGPGKRYDITTLVIADDATKLSKAELDRWAWSLGAKSRQARAKWEQYTAIADSWVDTVDDARAAGVPEHMIIAAATNARVTVPDVLEEEPEAQDLDAVSEPAAQ